MNPRGCLVVPFFLEFFRVSIISSMYADLFIIYLFIFDYLYDIPPWSANSPQFVSTGLSCAVKFYRFIISWLVKIKMPIVPTPVSIHLRSYLIPVEYTASLFSSLWRRCVRICTYNVGILLKYYDLVMQKEKRRKLRKRLV